MNNVIVPIIVNGQTQYIPLQQLGQLITQQAQFSGGQQFTGGGRRRRNRRGQQFNTQGFGGQAPWLGGQQFNGLQGFVPGITPPNFGYAQGYGGGGNVIRELHKLHKQVARLTQQVANGGGMNATNLGGVQNRSQNQVGLGPS
jgi:hypothetical protein